MPDQIFLAAVLISACSSYLLGNRSKAKDKWVASRPGRQRRPSGTKWERLYHRREKREKPCVESENGCCTKCPIGKFLNNCTCETCKGDTYLEFVNAETSCIPCDSCADAHQVEVEKCAPEHRRVCGCEDGYYRVNDHSLDSAFFSCYPCTDCAQSNKETEKNLVQNAQHVCGCPLSHCIICQVYTAGQTNGCKTITAWPEVQNECSETEDAKCGACPPEFQLREKTCQKMKIEPPDRRKTVYLLLCLPCLLLLGASIAYCKKKYISGKSSPVGIHTLVNSACKETLLAPAATTSNHKLEVPTEISLFTSAPETQRDLLHAGPSLPRSLLQGRKLYAVIDTVPVRRWKEFIRGLGLRDSEIEAVELEHTQLREQQYEMLKRWQQQQQGASLEAVFAVLEEMQLGGCAQELREQLEPSTLLPDL